MPDKDPKGGQRAADAEGEGGKKKPPIMIIAIVAVVLVAAAMFMVGKVSAKSAGGAAKHKKVEPGPVLPLDEFLVNLADDGGDHFLKISVNLELDKDKGKTPESLKERVPVIRDAVLTALSDKTRDEIGTAAGREKLKAEIKKDVNAAMGEEDIRSVYFTNFVTQ